MSKEAEKTEITKEEIAEFYKDYYDWIDSIYPLKSFQIQGNDGEQLNFYHGFNIKVSDDRESKRLSFYLRDNEYEEAYKEQKRKDLLGEKSSEKRPSEKFKTKAFIDINIEEKTVNFGVDCDHRGKGYGKAIYDNYLDILKMLGIQNPENYELRIYGNPEHDYFKRIDTKKLVTKTNCEPNSENALQILDEFAKHPNCMKFSEFNTIVEYAIKSGVPMENISKAINNNGFNIYYITYNGTPDFKEEDFKQFKSFGITGLKPTCMHDHFIRNKNFGFMKLLDNVDMKDATLEFKRIFEYVQKEYKEEKDETTYIYQKLKKFGELEHIILDWEHCGLLLKYVNQDIKEIVKKQAISKFDEFDPERRDSWRFQIDHDTFATLSMLRDAGLMDKDTYIQLYQKALNRNHNLEEFEILTHRFISEDERKLAKEEISQNTYYPAPKKNWQKVHGARKEHRILKVQIPESISKKGNVRDIVKREILRQGIAKKTKIKTDMTGVSKDGKSFVVDNLKDWMFGVPGAHGNLQIMGNNAIAFPPQTPQFAADLIEQALRNIEYPDLDER